MTVPTALRAQVRAVMDEHWRPLAGGGGFTVPHAGLYPWQWLWDSCFHALIWAALGEADRAVAELRALFRHQDAHGFVPHIAYNGEGTLAAFWGRADCSSITQPPMYGHAVAALVASGIDVPADVVDGAVRGLGFLLRERRRDKTGLLTVVHPWETGCDDSPRFDHWGAANRSRWYDAKGALVASVTRGPDGSPLANDAFGCAPAGFNALVAWNARELAALTGDRSLAEPAAELAGALSYRWDPERATWADAGPSAGDSGRTRTAEGLLAVLVDPARLTEVRRVIADPAGFGGPFGPTGVHRGEAAYNPERYWRGPVWPQLAYLLAVAGVDEVRAGTVAGARASGFAEYWHPEDGRGLGAIPQSWTGLCLLLARDGA